MLFNSLGFLYGFLPITYLVFWQLEQKGQRYIWLALTGYIFYSFWNYKFCSLMLFSTCVSYFAGLGFLRWQKPFQRRLLLIIPITIDLLLLCGFKYTNFALDTAVRLAHFFGLPLIVTPLSIILPVGISFYTFHTITYIVDSYRGTIKPTRNFFEFACYVSLFSQLVAGPIVRFREVEKDLENLDKTDRKTRFDMGSSFFLIGLAKKVLIADTLATLINTPLQRYSSLSTLDSWMCMIGYTYQLYFDFSGYSDMAEGLGLLFGIRLPQNFNSPYKALDITDFWRRWHISLSSCLRDYLYIPLGGNRGSNSLVNRNLLITMLIGGLWHGANWTFVIWGAYHGLLLVGQKIWNAPWRRMPLGIQRALTFFLIIIGWVFFRSDDLSMAAVLLFRMFSWQIAPPIACQSVLIGMLFLAGGFAHFLPNSFEWKHEWRSFAGVGLCGLFVLCLFMIYGAQQSPFLYFQF